MRRPVIVPRAVGVAVLVLAFAGCGDGGNGGSTRSASRPTQAVEQPTPSTTKPVVAWPAPSDPLERTVAAGLTPDVREGLNYHVHAHLDVFVDGRPIVVPAGIGINIDDPDVHRFPEADGSTSYGGIQQCHKPCISPLHTHDITGILHTESAVSKPNTLGEFFTEWGVRLSSSCVGQYCTPTPLAFYVDGKPSTQQPGAIELTDHEEIAVVIGTPPAQIPTTADFSKA